MTTHGEGHGRPESGPPGGLVEVLTRWERSGGHWRVTAFRDDWIEIALLTCGSNEQVSRLSGLRTSVLHDYLAGRTSSEEDPTPRSPG
ncbi:hypothetical protein [Nocardioides rubriscoriae]|uniref:hypothetical protein n=1 Tax=Nocardioides rubriscoriae TaxID=642762 RepID=UPI0011DFEE32|nr:hypothetical protein [Nocardioides rubriscoriae]